MALSTGNCQVLIPDNTTIASPQFLECSGGVYRVRNLPSKYPYRWQSNPFSVWILPMYHNLPLRSFWNVMEVYTYSSLDVGNLTLKHPYINNNSFHFCLLTFKSRQCIITFLFEVFETFLICLRLYFSLTIKIAICWKFR